MKKIYILHGWSFRNTQPWEQVKTYLAKKGIKAELLCVPGFDLTKEDKRIYTIQDYVNFAKKRIPKGSIALGHSNGGRILLNLMSQDANHLKGAILLSSAGVYEPSRKRDILRSLSKIFAPLKGSRLIRKIVHKITGASDYSQAPENMKQTLSNMLDSDKDLDLSRVTTPVRLIWGEDDNVTPLRQGKKIKHAIKGSTLKTIPGWSHAPYLQDPERLANVISTEYEKIAGDK